MKNKITRLFILLALTAIAALCMAQPVRAGSQHSNASRKPSHGGGGSGGSTLPYPTASTVSQLIADINYANTVGGAITFSLAPGAVFELKTADNTSDGDNGLPVIGGIKAVNLTILGNGAIIERIDKFGRYYIVENPFRLLKVSAGASLTLDHVTLRGGGYSSGGGILNQGTLNILNDCILSSNTIAVYNSGGTVTVRNSTLSRNSGGSGSGSGIYNVSGTVSISDSAIAGNGALYNGGGIYNLGGSVTISHTAVSGNSARFGGGIYNSRGTVTLNNGSILSDCFAFHADYPWAGGVGGGIYNDGGIVTINNSTVSGNSSDVNFGTGGGIYNEGAVTVENSSSITGNSAEDVENRNLLYLDGTSTIGILNGNPAVPF
jgi:hypothetical protein